MKAKEKEVEEKKVKSQKRAQKKRKHSKAFTLIELLAVIIILGVLMIVAIPAVTSYISESRKSSYATTAQNIVSGARTLVNSGKLQLYDIEATYYIPYDMVSTENGTSTPYGDFQEAYIVATYDGNGYDYYFTGYDTSKTGIYLTPYNDIDSGKILTGVNRLDTSVSICGKDKIIVYDKTGNVVEVKDSDDCVNRGEAYVPETDCTYKLIANYGSFSRTSDEKEICVHLNNDYTYTYPYTGFLSGRKYDGYEGILDVRLSDNYFTDSSYIRVWNNENKEQLLAEYKKADFPRYRFDLISGREIHGTNQRSIGDVDSFYLEISPDLQQIINNDQNQRVSVMYGRLSNVTKTGPWVTKNLDIRKINTLIDTLNDLDMDAVCGYHSDLSRAVMLRGFSTCRNEQDSQIHNDCGGTTYYAQYYVYCDGIPK